MDVEPFLVKHTKRASFSVVVNVWCSLCARLAPQAFGGLRYHVSKTIENLVLETFEWKIVYASLASYTEPEGNNARTQISVPI